MSHDDPACFRLLRFAAIRSALDPELPGEALDVLRMLSGEGMTMAVVTHKIPITREIVHRVAFINAARSCSLGPLEQGLPHPR